MTTFASPSSSSSLPLGWTQIGRDRRGSRKRNRTEQEGGGDDQGMNDDVRCCTRSVCRHRVSSSSSLTNTSANNTNHPILRRCTKGRVIVCFLDTDPEWFQGFFFPESNQRDVLWGGRPQSAATSRQTPWRLLATQRPVDDCLACQQGGYRVVDLEVHYNRPCRPSISSSSSSPGSGKQDSNSTPAPTTTATTEEVFQGIEWTGGDMMHLSSPHVTLQPQRLATGPVAAAMARQVFGTMLTTAAATTTSRQKNDDTTTNNDAEEPNDPKGPSRTTTTTTDQDKNQELETGGGKDSDTNKKTEEDNDTTTTTKDDNKVLWTDTKVLKHFPDIAIVAGTMELHLPIEKEEQDLYDLMFEQEDTT